MAIHELANCSFKFRPKPYQYNLYLQLKLNPCKRTSRLVKSKFVLNLSDLKFSQVLAYYSPKVALVTSLPQPRIVKWGIKN